MLEVWPWKRATSLRKKRQCSVARSGASGRASRSWKRSQSSLMHSHISFEIRSRTTRAFSRARRRLLRTEPGLALSRIRNWITRALVTSLVPKASA